ncbi:hypothetical protein F5Y03DRAFT_264225 [Xylaria venustula]|nr:hypothetical protein F5Y03DRAFT_264225 [Xylaria venustula]
MPPHSFTEWMVGQNYRPRKKQSKESNRLRHVVSFEVLTDDESSSDIYKIAVPRGKPAHADKSRPAAEPIRSSLKQPSSVSSDSPTDVSTDVSEEYYTWDEESSDEEPDPTCPCSVCIRGRRKLRRVKQARVKKKKKVVPVVSSSEEETEEDIAAAVHAQHQAKKAKKKVSFADVSPEETESEASVVEVKARPKKGKKSAVAISVSSEEDDESEDSGVQTRIETKKGQKGGVTVALAMSSGDESESEASVVNVKPQAGKGKKVSAVVTPESSVAESESDAAPAKGKKADTAKSKKGEGDKPKDSKAQKNTAKDKKKKKDETESAESAESTEEVSPSETEEDKEDTEEEETKANSSKKRKQKGSPSEKEVKAKNSKGKDEKKTTSKKGDKRGEKKKPTKPVSESESESETVSETEPESEVEVEAPKKSKSKSKSKKEKEKWPKQITQYPPPGYPPYLRQPNMLLPPQTTVMQLEHAVEDPQDPRPNAFFDNDSGTTRVYHGPAYGNPYGMLYPKRIYDYQNLPVGVPHPAQNPWYNGFPPPASGQPVPRNPPLQPGAADETNPWFRGWGTVGPTPLPPNIPLPPEFAPPSKEKKNQKSYAEQYNRSPPRSRASRDRDAGWDSNVMPSIERDASSKGSNHSQGSKAWSTSGRPWDAQGVSGPSWSPEKPAEKKKKKKESPTKDVTNPDATLNKLSDLGKVLQEVAAKDSADLRAREERWSNRSGSNKERSPQPDSGWGGNANNTTNNNTSGGDGWDTGGGNGGWNAGNTNTGGDSAWDNAAANNASSWDNSGWNNNNGWDNANTNNNNNTGDWDSNNNNNGGPSNTNNDGWGDNNNNNGNNNEGWDNNANNNTTNDWTNNDNNTNTWQPTTGSPPPNPIPGTWASPVLSNNSNKPPSNWSGGNVAANGGGGGGSKDGNGNGNGWGDKTLAQSSGGYWDTKEGQADISKGGRGNDNGKKKDDGNASWW